MNFLHRTLPLSIAFFFGVAAIVQYYIPAQASQDVYKDVLMVVRIVGGFALFLGIYSLFSLHIGHLKRRQPGWGYSIFVFAGFGSMTAAMLWNQGAGPFVARQAGDPSKWFTVDWLYFYIQVPCDATMFSLLAFFIASAAYRTFRARTTESTILLLAAVVLMLGSVPAAVVLYDGLVPGFLQFDIITHFVHEGLPKVGQWLMDVPNMAAKRGILLGVSLGVIATSLRIIFGIERAYLGGGGD